MGVGRYNTTVARDSYEPDFSGPAFSYRSPAAPPQGLGGIEDQRNINWQMAQRYGQQYAQDNRNIMALYDEAMRQWENNPLTRSATPPKMPALYQTDPNQLYGFFNSGEVGIPTTTGVVPYSLAGGPMTRDPLQVMSDAGTPTPVPATANAPGTVTGFAPNIPRGGPAPGPQSASTAAQAPGAPQPPGGNPGLTLPAVDAPVPQYPVPPAKPMPTPAYQQPVPSSAQRPGFNNLPPSNPVEDMQLNPPRGPEYRFRGFPQTSSNNPVATGAPPAPSVPAPSASGRGTGSGRTAYNNYSNQYRPSAAMSGSYNNYTPGGRRRY